MRPQKQVQFSTWWKTFKKGRFVKRNGAERDCDQVRTLQVEYVTIYGLDEGEVLDVDVGQVDVLG